ncbi:MAG TPA: AAA family ATPase [Chloroflexota bacterium]|nr:AAA family ATPase [Chloroflexota bacterium]
MRSESHPNGEQVSARPHRAADFTRRANAATREGQPEPPVQRPVPLLQIDLFGEGRVVYDGAPVPAANTARLHALLAFLLLHRGAPQARHHLAYLFWPDATEENARNNLRQLLHLLRRALPDPDRFLSTDAATLSWRDDAPCGVDIADFERLLAQAEAAEQRQDRAAQRDALVEAVGLYRADLLPGCYDDWIVPERERLRQRYLQALAALVQCLEAQRDYAAAIRYAQDWVRYDPLAEDAYRALMRLLALGDDRAGALRVYHACVTALRRELGVDPSPATRDVYERLLHLDAQTPPEQPATPSVRPAAASPAFVGRGQEWAQLQAAWQRACAGTPCFVLISGEAGIGKSRLTEELAAWAGWQGVVARARSYPAEGQLSLAPITDWLRSDGLRPHLARLDPVWLSEVSRILPELLTEHRALPRPEPITEYGQRQRFFDALARAILAAPQPLLLVIDDLQWCDQETLEWLHFFLRTDPTARLLVVGCVRTEELPPDHQLHTFLYHAGVGAEVLEIALQPLGAVETAQLAAQVVGRSLDDDAARLLYQETEGIPLFVVETARSGIVAAPDRPLAAQNTSLRDASAADARPALPSRVYAVIAGRLRNLSTPARTLMGLAAVIGRAFTLDDLLAAGNSDEESAVKALDELWAKRIIREQDVNRFDFTHDKLREVAYAEISPPQRRLLHRRIAQSFEAAHAGDLDAVSGQIASHYEHAGLDGQAVAYYQRAAAVAQRVYANDDAINLLSRGLALLDRLPAGLTRDRQELSLLLALAPILRVAKGWAAPELERVLDRAQALCENIGDDAQRTQVLYGLQSLSVVQARLERVQYISDELDTLYRRSHGTAPPRFAGVMLTGAHLHLGRLREANEQFEAITASHDPDQLRRLEEAQGVNYLVLAQAWQAHALWCLGYPRSALSRGHDAVQLARDLAQPFNQALAAAYLAMLAQFCTDTSTARARAEEALELAEACKAPYYRAWSAILVAYARAWEQPDAEHIARLRDAIAAFTAAGARLRLPYYLALLAQVYGKAGRAEEGLAALDEAQAAARTHNERWWDAELQRLRGELLLARGAEAAAAETAMLRALEIARAQGARSLELRAATSVAQVWSSQGRAVEGRALLADLCAWFSEGHETPDLQAARLKSGDPSSL